MTKIKNYLYLDQALVNSIFSQYYSGLITSVTKGAKEKETLKSSLGFDLKIIKGNIGGDDSGESSTSEKLELHHYMFELLENELQSSGLIGDEQPIIQIEGNLTIVDAKNSADNLEGLPSLIKGMEAALKMGGQENTQARVDLHAMTNIVKQSKDLAKLIRQFASDGAYAYIGEEKISLDRDCILSKSAPEFSNLGKEFIGNYTVLGIKSNAQEKQNVQSDDILLTLGTAFTGLQDLLKISGIRPIAIYRQLSNN
jgi:hypothetical protein